MDVKITPRRPGDWSTFVEPPEYKGAPVKVGRQPRRAMQRKLLAEAAREQADLDKRARAQAKRERQARREKSGFYDGTPALAKLLGQRFGRLGRQLNDDGKLVRVG